MTTTTPPTTPLAGATTSLQRYAVAAICASAAMQIVLAAFGSTIGLLAAALTAVIAVGYAGFLVHDRGQLGRVRFGLLASHVVTFGAVVGGFLLHFFALAATGNSAVNGSASDGDFVMDPGWFGVVIGMPTFWSLGLLLHALGAILGRGFEASR